MFILIAAYLLWLSWHLKENRNRLTTEFWITNAIWGVSVSYLLAPAFGKEAAKIVSARTEE
jgi:hypothetical protein